MVRLFAIQHDCGHGAFFSQRSANDWIGRIASVLTLTPYEVWRRMHATHHASTGNLDKRGFGDVDTLTVEEYRARSFWGRLRYRLYRHPLVMFGLGPAYLFILQHRLPIGLMRDGWRPWISTMTNNLAIVLVAGLLDLAGRPESLPADPPADPAALRHRSASGCSSSSTSSSTRSGTTIRTGTCTRPRCMAARTTTCRPSCAGSPPISASITSIISAAAFPTTGCRSVLRDHPELRDVGRLTLMQSFRCVRLVLWDETQRRLVSFREARASAV